MKQTTSSGQKNIGMINYGLSQFVALETSIGSAKPANVPSPCADPEGG